MPSQQPDIGEKRAKEIAVAYFTGRHPGCPSAHVQSVSCDGQYYVVRLIPENEWGILVFFVNYAVWVDRRTGNVAKVE